LQDMDQAVICTVCVKSTFLHVEADDRADTLPCRHDDGSRRRGVSLPSYLGRGREHDREIVYVDEGLGAGWRPAAEGHHRNHSTSSCCTSDLSTRTHSWSQHSGLSTWTREAGDVQAHPGPAVLGCCDSSASSLTTIMMRNLPKGYTREQLKHVLDHEGFYGRYDFLYVPYDFRTSTILGFAFLNLISPDEAQRFRKEFGGFRRWGIPSGKVCNLSWANMDQQGLETNIQRYRNSSVMHKSVPESCKPMILAGGVPIKFPKSSKKLWPPHADFGNHTKRIAK
jgi:hypothetical protein